MYSTDLLYMKKDVLLNCRIMYQSGIQIISCRTEGAVKNSIEFFRSPFLPLFAINNWIYSKSSSPQSQSQPQPPSLQFPLYEPNVWLFLGEQSIPSTSPVRNVQIAKSTASLVEQSLPFTTTVNLFHPSLIVFIGFIEIPPDHIILINPESGKIPQL